MNRNKKTVRSLCFGIMFFVLLIGNTLCVIAETTLKSITVSNSMPAWESGMFRLPEFKAPKECELEMTWITSESSFSPGKTANAQITLFAKDGYKFANNISVTVKGAKVTSKSVSSDSIVLKIKVDPLYYKLDVPEQVAWKSESSSVVKWSAVKYATGYKIKVYHDNKVIKQETVKTKTYDAGKYFNGENEVSVSVSAIGTDSSNSKYIRQGDECFVNGSDVDWDDNDTTYGVWKGNRYRVSADGEPAEYAIGWTEIFGNWYFFNQSGTLQTGWIQDGDSRYYADDNGIMQTGWVKPKVDDTWYYFQSSGRMATGWVAGAPGTWYYLGTDGAMLSGWIQDNHKWYFMGIDGKMTKGWQQINGLWYYFYEDGHMAAAEIIDSYYINGDGVWSQ